MRPQAYLNFRSRIQKIAQKSSLPLRMMFELTYRCNFSCGYCYLPLDYRGKSQEEELSTRQIFSILSQLAEMGCFYLGLTGGEPFIRPDILDILWFAKKKGFEIIIHTNASLIDKKIAQELGRIRPNKIDITLAALSRPVFKRICGKAQDRDKVLEAIKLLDQEKINLGFKTCVLKENFRQIEKISALAANLGALHRTDYRLFPRLDGSSEPLKYRNSIPSILSNMEDELFCSDIKTQASRHAPTDRRGNNRHLFFCTAGSTHAAITPKGELKICLMIDFPKFKILDNSLKHAWERLKALVSSFKLDKDYRCYSCELRAYCNWCPARSWLQERSFKACSSDSRLWAQALKERLVKVEK